MYGDSFDLSHIINSISFGEEFPGAVKKKKKKIK